MKTWIMLTLGLLVFSGMASVQAEDGTSKTGRLPGSLRVSDPVSGDWLATAGATVCQNLNAGAPGFCASAALIGGGIFDVAHLNTGKTQAVLAGNLSVAIIQCNPCGFLNVSIGNDRDDDGSVTNGDAIDDDAVASGGDGDGHGTGAGFDDQWADGTLGKPIASGSTIRIPFCFAHDAATVAAGHDWDSFAIFTRTSPDNPSVGTANITLEVVEKVGDTLASC